MFARYGAIHKMRDDGTPQPPIQLTSPPSGSSDFEPSVLPPGRSIVFHRETNGHTDLYKINSNGTGLTQVTDNGSVDDDQPECGTNGLFTYVLFRSTRDSAFGEIYRMKPDGSEVVRLTNNDLDLDADPAWCGTNKIVFARQKYGEPEYEVWIRDLNPGGTETPLTDNESDQWGYVNDRHPVCSPDGNFVVFSRGSVPIYTDLIKLNINTGEEVNLTPHPSPFYYGDEEWPSYSPGGSYITFSVNTGSGFEIWKMEPTLGAIPIGPLQSGEYDIFPDWGELSP